MKSTIEKIKSLIHHDDFSSVLQGIELFTTLEMNEYKEVAPNLQFVNNYQHSYVTISEDTEFAKYIGLAFYGLRLQHDKSFRPETVITQLSIDGDVPPQIECFQDLERLTIDLPYSRKEDLFLPLEIGRLSKLKELNINAYSCRVILPDTLAGLTSLETINWNSNEDIDLPKSFDQLGALQTLRIGDIGNTDSNFDALTNLQELSLGSRKKWNSRNAVSLFTKENVSLKTIKIEEGSDILPNWLHHLKGIQSIDINGKDIQDHTLPKHVFEHLKSITFYLKGEYTASESLLTYPKLERVLYHFPHVLPGEEEFLFVPPSYRDMQFLMTVGGCITVAAIETIHAERICPNNDTDVILAYDHRNPSFSKSSANWRRFWQEIDGVTERPWFRVNKHQKNIQGQSKILIDSDYDTQLSNEELSAFFDEIAEDESVLSGLTHLKMDRNIELPQKMQEHPWTFYANYSANTLPTNAIGLEVNKKQLKTLSSDAFPNVKRLNIQEKYYQHEKKKIDLDGLKNFELETLDIRENNGSIKIYDLVDENGVPLISLPMGLTAIQLDKWQFQILDQKLPTSIKYLKLTGTCLREFPQSICELSNLRHLDLRGNKFEELPPQFFELSHLEYLHLGSNALRDSSVLEGLSNFKKLRHLHLDLMGLSELPDLHMLDQLETVSVFGNQLVQIESSKLPSNLQYLDVGHNKIHRIEGDLSNNFNQNISTGLDLSYNQFQKCESLPTNTAISLIRNPDLIHIDPKATRIKLDAQQAVKILPTMKDTALRYLELSNAGQFMSYEEIVSTKMVPHSQKGLSEEVLESFEHLANLKTLVLSHNNYQKIPKIPSSLQNLYLDNNQIQSTENYTPQLSVQNSQLEVLDISENQNLSALETLHELTKIQEIDLQKCAFDDIPTVFGQTPNLQSLELSGNPMQNISSLETLPPAIAKTFLVLLVQKCFPPLVELEGWGEEGEPSHYIPIKERKDFPFALLYSYTLNPNEAYGAGHSYELSVLQFQDQYIRVEKKLTYVNDCHYTVSHECTFFDNEKEALGNVREWFAEHLFEVLEYRDRFTIAPLYLFDFLKEVLPKPEDQAHFELSNVSGQDIAEILMSISRKAVEYKEFFLGFHSHDVKKSGHIYTENEMVGVNAQLPNSNFKSVYFQSVNLSGANLRGSDFQSAIFASSNVCGVDFRDSNIKPEMFVAEQCELYFRSSNKKTTYYDHHTQWPEGFEPTESEGLQKINMEFYRHVRAKYTKNLREGSWQWGIQDYQKILRPFGITIAEEGKTIIPEEMMNVFMDIMSYFIHPKPSVSDMFEVGDCEYITDPVMTYSPIQQRFQEEKMDESCYSFWRNDRSTEHMLWLFPDGRLLENMNWYEYFVEECSNVTTDLLEFEDEKTWVVLTNQIFHFLYCDENFDLDGTFEYTFFDNKQDAYLCWEQKNKDNFLQQIKDVRVLKKWSNHLTFAQWSRFFPKYFKITSPFLWEQLQDRELWENETQEFVNYCASLAERWKVQKIKE